MIRTDKLIEVPRAEWPYNPQTINHNVERAWRNSDIVVLEYRMRIWWGWRRIKIRHLAIKTRQDVALYKFYSLMDIKNQICGEECAAVQVYPKQSEIMDAANLSHLFVFPEKFKLPLTLQRKWK